MITSRWVSLGVVTMTPSTASSASSSSYEEAAFGTPYSSWKAVRLASSRLKQL
jgi:hypothetical protein